jgi:SAM-dependent methyltransferase
VLERHHRELAKIEGEYWWFRVRFRVVAQLLRSGNLVCNGTRLLDWGCGTGGFLDYLLSTHQVAPHQVCGVEPGEHAQQVLRGKGIPSVPLAPAAALRGTIADQPTVITMLDVLEHVDDRVGVLRELHALAAPGASLILTVPAFKFLWSEWDTVLGHKTRYTIRGLQADLRDAGWQPQRARYIFNSMFFPAFLRSVVLKRSIAQSEFPRIPACLNRLLTAWHSLESRVPGIPFGTSILCLARRDDASHPEAQRAPDVRLR